MLMLAQFSNWNYWMIMPQLIAIIVTTIIIISVSIVYYRQVKKMNPEDDPRGIVLIVELIIKYVEKLVVDILGVKYKRVTIYLMYLMLYILIGNWLSIIGLESQASSYTVTLSLALVTFFGIYYLGIKFQKISFFKRYLNPLELISQFAPLISLSFRLFGNIIGGSVILTLFYSFNFFGSIPVVGQLNFLIAVIAPFLHIYFDLFAGSIQALIFGVLTMVYWKLQMETSHGHSELEIKLPRKIRQKRKKESNINEVTYDKKFTM